MRPVKTVSKTRVGNEFYKPFRIKRTANVLELPFGPYQGFLEFALVRVRKVKKTLAGFEVQKRLITFVFFLLV